MKQKANSSAPSKQFVQGKLVGPRLWTKLSPKRIPKHRLPGVEVLAQEVSRSQKGHPRHALFLGAGASFTSGIPTAAMLIEQWRLMFFNDRGADSPAPGDAGFENAFNSWMTFQDERDDSPYEKSAREWEQQHERHPSEYAFLFNFIASRPFARQEFIERVVSDKEPGPGYIYLASLIRESRFRTVLTTNFDDLVHDALFRYADLKPAICAFDSQITSIHPNTARPVVIKLHGDFMYNNLRNVGPEVQQLSQNMRDKLFQTCKQSGLIVIGYGGSDDSVMTPLTTMLHDGNSLEDGLHWCIHTERNDDEVTIPGEVWRLYESHRDRVKLYRTEGFDDAMERMYLSCGCEMPTNLTKPREKTLHRRLVNALEAIDRRWRVSKHFNGLLNEFRQADQDDRSWDVICIEEAQHHFTNAKGLQQERRFEEAKAELEAAIQQCDLILKATENTNNHKEHPVPGTASLAQALRRKSGAVTQLVDLEFTRRGLFASEVRSLSNQVQLRDLVRQYAAPGLADGLRGLELARATTTCAPLIQPLIYNLLASLGYLRLVDGKPLTGEHKDIFTSLRNEMTALDVTHEDITELRRDSHGYQLADDEN